MLHVGRAAAAAASVAYAAAAHLVSFAPLTVKSARQDAFGVRLASTGCCLFLLVICVYFDRI